MSLRRGLSRCFAVAPSLRGDARVLDRARWDRSEKGPESFRSSEGRAAERLRILAPFTGSMCRHSSQGGNEMKSLRQVLVLILTVLASTSAGAQSEDASAADDPLVQDA